MYISVKIVWSDITNGSSGMFYVVGVARGRAQSGQNFELDQLERKPLETNGKMFGTLQTYTNGHCQTI